MIRMRGKYVIKIIILFESLHIQILDLIICPILAPREVRKASIKRMDMSILRQKMGKYFWLRHGAGAIPLGAKTYYLQQEQSLLTMQINW